jgi:PAS domain S-box-containing protein
MPVGFHLIGRDWRWLYANRTAVEHVGVPGIEALDGLGLLELRPAVRGTEIHQRLGRCMDGGPEAAFEHEVHRVDGRVDWYSVRIQPHPDGLLLLSTDITDRKRLEATLREDGRAHERAREELTALLRTFPTPLVGLDDRAHVTLWNTAAERVFGWSEREILHQPVPLVSQDTRSEFTALFQRLRAGEHFRVITTRTSKDGRAVPVNLSAAGLIRPDGTFTGAVAMLVDLSEQRALRSALSDSEHRFAAVFDATPDAQLLLGATDHRVVEVNQAYLTMFGLTRGQVVGARAGMLLPLSRPRVAARLRTVFEDGRRLTDVEFWFDERRAAIVSAERMVIGSEPYVLLVIKDVTARREAERALHESDALFRQITDTIDEVFWLTDTAKGTIVYVSPGYARIWGRTCESLYANPREWIEAIHPEDRERVLHAALTKQTVGTYDEEYRVVRPDGVVRWVRDRGYPVRDATGNVFRVAGSAQDVTRQRDLEAQLRQTQKMESIGLLAGGIAHDFNNLLTVIAGNCDALLDELPKGEEAYAITGEIRDAGDRAAALTRQLLSFSRKEVMEARVVDLGSVVADTEKLLRRVLGEDVLLQILTGPEPLWVRIDPGSWVQVLMNLAVNARDAMPRGGKLTITTGWRELTDQDVEGLVGWERGRYAQLAVHDNGIGMSQELQTRIFEPFFTTKRVGEGTGLGLSVVHGIVTGNGGHIAVSSEVGQGTTFLMHLPTVTAARLQASTTHLLPTLGSETILLVEDEESIRRFAVRALSSQGYTVLQAADGAAALGVIEKHDGPLHLVVTDVVMPRMDGRELADKLRELRPEARVLYVSGYTDDAVVRRGVLRAEVAFLPKPYDLPTLRRRVREVLDEPRSA